jgi:hypothetical protein
MPDELALKGRAFMGCDTVLYFDGTNSKSVSQI